MFKNPSFIFDILCTVVWLVLAVRYARKGFLASVVQLVQYIFGAVLIFHGVVDLQGALALMGQGYSRWWVDLLLAVLTLALGVLVVVNPFGTFAALMGLVGASLIFDGVTDLVIIWRLSRAFKDI